MIGLYFLGILGLWVFVAGLIAKSTTRHWRGRSSRLVLGPLVFVVVVILPFVDEIVGKYQFRTLCREGAVPRYDEAKARGRSVYMRQVPHPQVPRVQTTPSRLVPAWIPITEKTIDWLDKETDEVLVSYKAYEASSGWFIRAIWPETTGPLMFDPDSCRPNSVVLFKQLNIKSD